MLFHHLRIMWWSVHVRENRCKFFPLFLSLLSTLTWLTECVNMWPSFLVISAFWGVLLQSRHNILVSETFIRVESWILWHVNMISRFLIFSGLPACEPPNHVCRIVVLLVVYDDQCAKINWKPDFCNADHKLLYRSCLPLNEELTCSGVRMTRNKTVFSSPKNDETWNTNVH